jgi:hypothetical protein
MSKRRAEDMPEERRKASRQGVVGMCKDVACNRGDMSSSPHSALLRLQGTSSEIPGEDRQTVGQRTGSYRPQGSVGHGALRASTFSSDPGSAAGTARSGGRKTGYR